MTGGDDSELTMDTAFDLLSNPRRRFTLYYLNQQEGEVPLSEVAAQVAAWENDTQVEELSDSQEKRTYVSLYQTHFPKLTEVGVIRFDRDRSVVELTDRAQELAEYIPAENRERRWPLYYLTLALVAVLVQGLAFLDLVSIGLIPDGAVGVVFVIGIGLLAIGHLVIEQRAASADFSRLKRQ